MVQHFYFETIIFILDRNLNYESKYHNHTLIHEIENTKKTIISTPVYKLQNPPTLQKMASIFLNYDKYIYIRAS